MDKNDDEALVMMGGKRGGVEDRTADQKRRELKTLSSGVHRKLLKLSLTCRKRSPAQRKEGGPRSLRYLGNPGSSRGQCQKESLRVSKRSLCGFSGKLGRLFTRACSLGKGERKAAGQNTPRLEGSRVEVITSQKRYTRYGF